MKLQKEYIDKVLSKELIKESYSPAGVIILFAKKKIDYRGFVSTTEN
jgi:hypothetical protein